MEAIMERLGQAFICSKCHSLGAKVERLSISGTGISRLLDSLFSS